MQKKSTSGNSPKSKKTGARQMPQFKSEAEEAEWYHSPAGRRWLKAEGREAAGQEVLTVDKPLAFSEQMRIVRESNGRPVRFTKTATDLTFSDRAALKALIDRVKERSEPTLPISLRLRASDVRALKAWSKKNGVGYQTLIKEAVHDLAQRLS